MNENCEGTISAEEARPVGAENQSVYRLHSRQPGSVFFLAGRSGWHLCMSTTRSQNSVSEQKTELCWCMKIPFYKNMWSQLPIFSSTYEELRSCHPNNKLKAEQPEKSTTHFGLEERRGHRADCYPRIGDTGKHWESLRNPGRTQIQAGQPEP